MASPYAHQDSEPLESIIDSLQVQIEREKDFQTVIQWKLRLLERDLDYCQRQVDSFGEILDVPKSIAELGRENQTLDENLRSQRALLHTAIEACEDAPTREILETLVRELDHELTAESVSEGQERITWILGGYSATGIRYMEECQARIRILSHRIEQLKGEYARSREDEETTLRMCTIASQFGITHPKSTYGTFREYVLQNLGRMMEKDLEAAIERLSAP